MSDKNFIKILTFYVYFSNFVKISMSYMEFHHGLKIFIEFITNSSETGFFYLTIKNIQLGFVKMNRTRITEDIIVRSRFKIKVSNW